MAYKMQKQFGDRIDQIAICDQRSIGRQDFSKIDYVFYDGAHSGTCAGAHL